MQNFGKIKNVFNSLLAESLGKNDEKTKDLFKKYVKIIKESEILKTQFLIYNNIENKVDSDPMSAFAYVSENLKLLEKFNQSEILKENKKLSFLINSFKEKLEEDYDLSNLHESISDLIFIKRTPQNVEKVMTEIKKVTEYITANKEKTINEKIDLPLSLMTKLMVDKYNQKYSSLDENEKKLLKVLISTDVESKKDFYNKTVDECLSIINQFLIESENESEEKLLKVKNKLSENKEEITNENFLNKITKLLELKNNLI